MAEDYNKLGGLIEWTTVPYRKVKFWILLFGIMLLSVGGFYGFVYLRDNEKILTTTKQSGNRESRPAALTDIEGNVRVKQVNRTDWVSARRIPALNMGDVIETSASSTCKIVYFDGTTASISENTLYVVAESFVNSQTEGRVIKGEITTGEVRMNTSERRATDSVKLTTDEAEAALSANSEATGRRNQSAGTSSFFVWGGKAEVFSRKDQKTTTLTANQQMPVTGATGSGPVRVMPTPPELVAPGDMEPILLPSLPAKVLLRWKPVKGIHQYRVRVFDNPAFSNARYNQVIKATTYQLSSLGAGTYFWQVASVDTDGVESGNPTTSKFFISSPKTERYGKPIRLEVTKTARLGDMLKVEGQTDPGVRLTINGQNVDLDGHGRFKVFLSIGAAPNLILVARDILGNITSKTLPLQ
jgi:hypothetical protein